MIVVLVVRARSGVNSGSFPLLEPHQTPTTSMSLCTLPAPVSPQNLAMSPQIDVVLLTTDTHLMLCRKSGQQVWSTRLPLVDGQPDKVSSISWSPDGDPCAVVMESGSVVTYDVNSGRPVAQSQVKKLTNTSSVAWSPKSSRQQIISTVKFMNGPLLPSSELGTGSTFAAFGTRDGKLKISMFGALDIDELPLHAENQDEAYLVAAAETRGEYAAVQGTTLYVFKDSSKAGTVGPPPLDDVDIRFRALAERTLAETQALFGDYRNSASHEKLRTHQGAVATVFADELLSHSTRFKDTLESFRKTNFLFILPFFSGHGENAYNDERTRMMLIDQFRRSMLAATMVGSRSEQLVGWINSQHEQGFKRWYKNQTLNLDALNRLTAQEILPVLEDLLQTWSLLEIDERAIDELHEMVFEIIINMASRRQMFEQLACYIEHMFREEIDRPIAVTRLSSVSLPAVGKALIDENLFGDLDSNIGISVSETAQKVHRQVYDAVSKIKSELKGVFTLAFRAELGERVTHIRQSPDSTKFKLILESGVVAFVDAMGSVVKAPADSSVCSTFVGNTDEIISLDAERNAVILPNGETVPLEFEAVAIAARRENQNVVACVLSEDCRHYQFIQAECDSNAQA